MTRGSADVICVGAATEDVIALVDRLPAPDERLEAIDIVVAGGGPAATAAVTLARQGASVAYVGVIADDEIGQRIRAGLEAERVDVSELIVCSGLRSGLSLILVDRRSRTRAIVNRPPPQLVLPESAVARCRSARWVHVDQAGYPAVVAAGLLDRRTDRGPQVSIDAGNPIPDLSLRGVDLFAPTEQSLLDMYVGQGLADAIRSARAAGADTVVVSRGSRGSVGMDPHGCVNAPGFEVDVCSTLGAGDVFHGQLLAGLLAQRSLDQALVHANAAAALSCLALDGRSRIPRPGDLDAFLAGARGR